MSSTPKTKKKYAERVLRTFAHYCAVLLAGRYCIFYVIGHIVFFLSVCIILSMYV